MKYEGSWTLERKNALAKDPQLAHYCAERQEASGGQEWESH
jgi:hypothetical protein